MDKCRIDQQSPVEYLPMTFPQKWVMNQMHTFKRPGWINIDFLVKTKMQMDEAAMEKAVLYLVNKYETLRVRITNREGKWVQEVYGLSEADPFAVYDLTGDDLALKKEKVKQTCIDERNMLCPWKGNLIRVIFFKFSENEGRLWFCLHHIISDFVSVMIVSNEFMATYNSIVKGKELKWKIDKDYRKWMYMVEGYTRDVLLPAELKYWLSLPWEKARILPSDYPDRFPNEAKIMERILNKENLGTFRIHTQWMDQDLTTQLFNKSGAEFENILIAVFFLAVAVEKNMDWLDLNICNAGRNILPPEYEVNASKLLGYTAISRAMLLRRPSRENLMQEIQDVIEQMKKVPNGGMGYYLISEHLNNDQFRKFYFGLRQIGEVFFNYLGRVNTNFSNDQYETVDDETGLSSKEEEFICCLLACNVGIRQNQLFVRIFYTEEYLKPGTIERITQSMMAMFREMLIENILEKVA